MPNLDYYDLEKALKEQLQLDSVIDSVNKTSKALRALTKIVDKGLSNILDERKATYLSNEYYLLLDRLMTLKEKHPELTLSVDLDELSVCKVKLSDEMITTLSYMLTFCKEKDNWFELFQLDCMTGKCLPEHWLYSFFNRAEHSVKRKQYSSYFETNYYHWNKYNLTLYNSFMIDLYKSSNNKDLDSFNETLRKIDSRYRTDDNDDYLYISKGYNKIVAWISEQNCISLIQYLKNIYSKAVIQVLNA